MTLTIQILQVGKNSVPYVAYMDATSNKATVRKYSAGAWTTVGTIGFSASSAGYLTIATSPVDGVPYVAYQDGSSLGKATVEISTEPAESMLVRQVSLLEQPMQSV